MFVFAPLLASTTAPPRLGAVDFSGTLFVADPEENDFLGFVFSFQNTSRFYIAQWKRTAETYLGQDGSVSKPYWHIYVSTVIQPGHFSTINM